MLGLGVGQLLAHYAWLKPHPNPKLYSNNQIFAHIIFFLFKKQLIKNSLFYAKQFIMISFKKVYSKQFIYAKMLITISF